MPNNPLELNSSDLTYCDSMVLRNIFWRILWISKWISFGWRIHYIKVLWSLVLFWSFRHNKQAKSTNCIENTSENAEEEFHFRWLKSKGIFVAFPFSITLFFNLIKWKSSKRYRKLMNGRIVEKLFQVSSIFQKIDFTCFFFIECNFLKVWFFSKFRPSSNFSLRIGGIWGFWCAKRIFYYFKKTIFLVSDFVEIAYLSSLKTEIKDTL